MVDLIRKLGSSVTNRFKNTNQESESRISCLKHSAECSARFSIEKQWNLTPRFPFHYMIPKFETHICGYVSVSLSSLRYELNS